MLKRLSLLVLGVFLTTGFGIVITPVSPAAAAEPAVIRVQGAPVVVVTGSVVNLRCGPGTRYLITGKVYRGEALRYWGQVGNWYYVQNAGGKTGFISAQYARFASQQPQPQPEPQPQPQPQPEPQPQPQPEPQPGVLTADEQLMLEKVNAERAANGLAPLEVDPLLVKVARVKATDMVNNNYFSHNSPTYGSPFDMMRQFGVSYRTAGENLAGNPSVADAHERLMASSGHRANILNPNFKRIGIGIVDGSPYGKIMVQMFAG